ncbi:MAG: histidine phosphatase family protein [Candidatus Thorarchaeota archaeon]
MILYILRHAQTRIDQARPAHEWHLSPEGVVAANELAHSLVFKNIDCIYASAEPKAQETAKPFSELFDLRINTHSGLNELYRGEDTSLSQDEYLSNIRCILQFPPIQVEGWESPALALSRFANAVSDIESEEYDSVLIVSHGLVLSLFFSSLLNIHESLYERWRKLRFLSWGQISNGIVLRDLV